MGKQWKQWQTLFWGGSKITAGGNCSHEIKRHLLVGRKVTTNLDSILKSKRHCFANKGPSSQSYGYDYNDSYTITILYNYNYTMTITIVVMYGCESWTIKKAECWRIDAFELWGWRRLLRVPWTARRSNQSILKEMSPKCSLEGVMLKLKPIFWPPDSKNWIIWKDPDAGKDRRQEEKGTAEDEMVGWHHWFNEHEFEQAPGVGDRQGSPACCSPWGCKESDMTEQLNWTEKGSWRKRKNLPEAKPGSVKHTDKRDPPFSPENRTEFNWGPGFPGGVGSLCLSCLAVSHHW